MSTRAVRQEVRVTIRWKKLNRREREVMERVLELRARDLTKQWDKEDGRVWE